MSTSQLEGEVKAKKVAVIGAGISGVTSAAHLLRQGLDVTVFERSSVAGGVWHYDSRTAIEPEYPNEVPQPSTTTDGDTDTRTSLTYEEASLRHAPPGPCYKGLRTNIPITLMRSSLVAWPEGTPDYVDHDTVERYINSIEEQTGVKSHTAYDTNVKTIQKVGNQWAIATRTLSRAEAGDGFSFQDAVSEFDAVVIASGHYHLPRVPNVPGLKEWRLQSPEGVLHSKTYRSSEQFKDKTIFLVGGGVSSLDIAKESAGVAKKVYQSTRNGPFDIPIRMMPSEVERVGPVSRFVPGPESSGPGSVILEDGSTVEGVDIIVLGTGYITSYPFLGDLQSPALPLENADDSIIITADGYTTHNLHQDVFYIPDPTLAFVGVPYHASSFSLFDFQGEMVARVFSGKAELPATPQLQIAYERRKANVATTGLRLHSLAKKDLVYMGDNLKWLNSEAARLGFEPVQGVGELFTNTYTQFLKEMEDRGLALQVEKEEVPAPVQAPGLTNIEEIKVVA